MHRVEHTGVTIHVQVKRRRNGGAMIFYRSRVIFFETNVICKGFETILLTNFQYYISSARSIYISFRT